MDTALGDDPSPFHLQDSATHRRKAFTDGTQPTPLDPRLQELLCGACLRGLGLHRDLTFTGCSSHQRLPPGLHQTRPGVGGQSGCAQRWVFRSLHAVGVKSSNDRPHARRPQASTLHRPQCLRVHSLAQGAALGFLQLHRAGR